MKSNIDNSSQSFNLLSVKVDLFQFFLGAFTIFILITLHLKIFTVVGFDLSVAFLLIPIWAILCFRWSPFRYYKYGLLFFLLSALLPFVPFNISDFEEFFKTYFQLICSSSIVFLIALYNEVRIKRNTLIISLKLFQIILSVVVAVQAIDFFFTGGNFFYNIWGGFQLYYELPPSDRMKGFYLEPSYLGFVFTNVFWLLMFLQRRISLFNLVITIILLFFCKSAFAYLSIFLLIGHYIIRSKLPIIPVIFRFTLGVTIVIFFSFFLQDFIRVTRLYELWEGQASGYIRMILPLFIIAKIASEGNYLGLAFGQAESLISEFITFDFGETGVNNSLYLLVIHFGILAIFGILYLARFLFLKRDFYTHSFILLTFMNLFSSGSFVTSLFVFISFLLPIIAFRLAKDEAFVL